MKNKKILITGGAGFIGNNLLKRLHKDNEIIVVDNLSLGPAKNLSWFKDQILLMDSDDEKLLNIKDLDYIFHFGAPCSVIQFNKEPVRMMKDTLHGFVNVLDVARETKAKIIYPSSGNVYGIANPQSENIEPKPMNLYALAKLCCEEIALKHYSDVNSVGLRIFAGYGPGEEHKKEIASVIALFLNDMIKDKSPIIWGDGFQTRDFIFIDDIINGLISTAENKVSKIINLGTGKSTSFNEVISIINKVLKKDIKPKYISKPQSYVEQTKADINLMKKELKIEPISLEEGIKKYINKKKVII